MYAEITLYDVLSLLNKNCDEKPDAIKLVSWDTLLSPMILTTHFSNETSSRICDCWENIVNPAKLVLL